MSKLGLDRGEIARSENQIRPRDCAMENVGTKQSAQDPLLQMLHMEILVEPDFFVLPASGEDDDLPPRVSHARIACVGGTSFVRLGILRHGLRQRLRDSINGDALAGLEQPCYQPLRLPIFILY